jgi:hypothetical protein
MTATVGRKWTAGAFTLAMLFASSVSVAQEQVPQEQREIRERFSALAERSASSEIVKLAEEVLKPQDEPITFWEEIKSCGFYPQETRLECVIEVKQRGGYGGPVGSFGSFEYVHLCVDWDNNGVFDTFSGLGSTDSVGVGMVHVHDESAGERPSWHYAVYRDIDPPGGLRTDFGGAQAATVTVGPTRKAKAILSWLFAPTDCDYKPIWGSALEFRVRLDPIR